MYKLLLAVALLTVVCDSSVRRDLSTPSKRLIGHWQYEDSTQICFDSTDSHTKIGAYVFTDKDSTSLYLNYRIIAEVKAGERIEVMKNPHTLAERGTAVHTVFIVSKDGLEFTEIQLLRDVLGAEELAPGAESLVIRVGSDLVTQKRRLQNVEKELLECRRVLGRSYSIIGERCVGIDTTWVEEGRFVVDTVSLIGQYPYALISQIEVLEVQRQQLVAEIKKMERLEASSHERIATFQDLDTSTVVVRAKYISK